MGGLAYISVILVAFVGGVVAQLDIGRSPADSGQANELHIQGTTSLNGTCFCLRQDLVVREEASSRSPILASVKLSECFRFNGKKTLKDEALWYEMRMREDTKRGWVESHHLDIAPDSACRRGKTDLASDLLGHAPGAEKDLGTDLQGFAPGTEGGSGTDLPGFAPGIVSQKCLGCICLQESGCKPIGCKWDVTSLSCGYFQIKENYWIDCYKPGGDWKTCANDLACASKCVQSYMKRYATYYGCPLTCEGFAREHNGGPTGCKKTSTLKYWESLQKLPGCHGVQ